MKEQQSREVSLQSDANFKQVKRIEILEKVIEARSNDVTSLQDENLKLSDSVRMLETNLKEMSDDHRKQLEENNTLSERVRCLEASLNETIKSTQTDKSFEARLVGSKETRSRVNQELETKSLGCMTTETGVQTDCMISETKVCMYCSITRGNTLCYSITVIPFSNM